MFDKVINQSIYFYNGTYDIKTLKRQFKLVKVFASGIVRLNVATFLDYPTMFTFNLISDKQSLFGLEDSEDNPATFHEPVLSNLIKWQQIHQETTITNQSYVFSLDFDCDINLKIGEKLSLSMLHVAVPSINQANSQGQLILFLKET